MSRTIHNIANPDPCTCFNPPVPTPGSLQSMSPASLSTIPVELSHLIASFIPLRSAPGTLHSLALVNHQFYDIIYPILYSRVILRNEDDAITVIQKILNAPQLGLAVKELYIMSELSVETRRGKKPFNVLVGLQAVITKGLIPSLFALGIYLTDGWCFGEDYHIIRLRGRLPIEFWKALRTECPRLCTLSLRNMGHSFQDPWLSPVIDEINSFSSLSSLRLEWSGDSRGLPARENVKIFSNLPRLTSLLHTLSLESEYQDANLVLCYDFPNLNRLRLYRFDSMNKTSKIMGFFKRHLQIESVSLIGCIHDWFSDDIEPGFLPNLKHLKARFMDIHTLILILPQLLSLAFIESKGAQVPCLLRAILPDGLPNLKSLEIKQTRGNLNDCEFMEGAQWYETPEQNFHIVERRDEMSHSEDMKFMMNGYMRSIAIGAPNIEELGLHGMPLGVESLQALAPILSQLVNMERFYYYGISSDLTYLLGGITPLSFDEEVSDFLSGAEVLARVCTHLAIVTSISNKDLPYISAKIERDSLGEVTEVRRSDGVGMLISADEDDPFPRHPEWL